ncbi:mucolipin-3 [Paramormyrops kingsleyae]|uniref:mucolipin-3 n=1 Tax=Paramormyrops kingsleyae TaxID=1676925 RepID=UPI003B96C249
MDDHCLNWDQAAVEAFRWKLKYFFMNPCEKYRARGRKPWKLTLQILKIAITTIQLVSFGLSNEMVVTFKEENLVSFKHIFLKGYSDRITDTYTVYTKDDVYDHILFIADQYMNLPNITVGNHAYDKNEGIYAPLSVCQDFYRNANISSENETFDIDTKIETECAKVYPGKPPAEDILEEFLKNLTLNFKRLRSVNINFTLKAINLQTIEHHELPDCYNFIVMITFDSRAHSGQIKINLKNDVDMYQCRDWSVKGMSGRHIQYTLIFDCITTVVCLASLILCSRSIISGIQLQFECLHFFRTFLGKNVPWSDRMEFVNGWYILIIVSDTLTIVGTILKIAIQTKNLTSYDVCSFLLGTATLFTWVGVIRYLGYFRKYNILILTLRAAFPNVVRFCCCASMIYLGYCFCGWIVLGPYHEKFRTMNTVSECLFSLINGDDMFTTFKNMQQRSTLVWLFSRLYLYSFVTIFIYTVLSLFITVITDTYETIKKSQQSGVPESELHAFLADCKDLPNSGMFKQEDVSSPCLSCCPR